MIKEIDCRWCNTKFMIEGFYKGQVIVCPNCFRLLPKRRFGFKGGYKK